jgi:hypothetical protein
LAESPFARSPICYQIHWRFIRSALRRLGNSARFSLTKLPNYTSDGGPSLTPIFRSFPRRTPFRDPWCPSSVTLCCPRCGVESCSPGADSTFPRGSCLNCRSFAEFSALRLSVPPNLAEFLQCSASGPWVGTLPLGDDTRMRTIS